MFILEGALVLVYWDACDLERTVVWVGDVDVLTWSGVNSFLLFVAWSCFGTAEANSYSLFLYYLVLQVIFLLLVIVLAWSWVDAVGLTSIGRFAFIAPEFTSFRLRQETLWLLPNVIIIRVGCLSLVLSIFN